MENREKTNFVTGTFTSSISVFISGAALLAFFFRRFLALFTSFSTFFQSTCTYPLWLAIWWETHNKNTIRADYLLIIRTVSTRYNHCGNIQQRSPANHIRSLLFTLITWQKSMFTKAWASGRDVSGPKHALIGARSVWTFLLFNICIPIMKPLAVCSCSIETWSTFRGQVSKQN